MTILPIVVTGEPVLHHVAQPVTAFDAQLHTLVDDMFETMYEAPGVGLAAPQIGLDARLFVYGWTDDEGIEHKGVAANPELWITPLPLDELDDDDDAEGCLSVPGLRFPTRRATQAILKAQDENGEPYEVQAEGWLARIFQHEYDHLDGILYVDRLEDPHAYAARKIIRKQKWGRPGLSWTPGVDDVEA
ncbi:peptide deformylase [Pseudoclavibacter sp. CFCC 13796]|uniref:peptide deformylase n=1 Tax=Pseudoclavibacter sp. CFCC 13796 TaxID=2615179 RepID=UPI0013017EFE|nr:peptide deformylase [Pseudoclavibacter sp. CFCC 13796]KAB1661530.1 peptide deformylase [Pseudoclavibacter sp. CFCC 13796]